MYIFVAIYVITMHIQNLGIEHNCFQAYIESNFNTVVYGIVRGDIAVDINMCIKYDLQWQLSPLY